MSNSKYIKSYSNYILRKKHQNVSGGTIFERDWTTIGGTNKFTAGQIPVYANSNFKITINNTANPRRKVKYGQWKKNSDNTDVWTWENVSGATSDTIEQKEVVLKNNYTSLSDFAYFGSCTELVRASITDIINKFPAELYFSTQKVDYVDDDGNIQYLEGYMVENPFQIDINTKSIVGNQNINLIRYMCQSYDKYVVIDDNTGEVSPVIGVTINVKKLDCGIQNNSVLSTTVISTKNKKYTIERRYVNDDVYFLSNTTGIRIRPNDEIIEEFFAGLDYFQSVLLNRQTNYRVMFETPYETDAGTLFTKNMYQWVTIHDWNLDINGVSYSYYLNKLFEIAQYYDNTVSDNLYRSMTHEAIKNFDWSYSRQEDEEITAEYIVGGAKIEKLIHIFGRQFDEIKRYVDGIKSVNSITYGSKNDLPNYFLTDSVDLAGFTPSEVLYNSWYDNDAGVGIITDVMYPGENDGYVAQEVENNFMRRFRINLKHILRAKGTKKSIEMLLSMFGVPRNWYSFKEYVYFADDFIQYKDCGNNLSCISNKEANAWVISKLNKYNLANSSSGDVEEENDFKGLMVRQLNQPGNNLKLHPWFDKKEVYNGNPYFQSAGGWGKSGNTYQETIKYLNILDTLDELSALPVTSLKNGDVYYINNQHSYYILKNVDFSTNVNVEGYEEGWRRINVVDSIDDLGFIPVDILSAVTDNEFYVISEGKYYKLVNLINHCDIQNGWKEVSGKSANEDVLKILYLDSIIDNNEGNNPHVGYGYYDGGQDFLNYYRELFKYSLESSSFDESLHKSIFSGASIESQGFKITQYEDNKKCWYFNSDQYGYSLPRTNFVHEWNSTANTPNSYFEFVDNIPSGTTLPEYSPNGYGIGDVFRLVNKDEDNYYRLVSFCYSNGTVSYGWNNIARPPKPYSWDWQFWENKGFNSYTNIKGNFYPELLINVKKFGIHVVDANIPSSYLNDFKAYFNGILVPFIKELVPSTAILEFGASLTLSKETVILMPSKPNENVLIDSSGNWSISGGTGVYKLIPNKGTGGGTNVNVSYTNFGKQDIVFTNGKENSVLRVMSIDVTTSVSGSSLDFTALSETKKIKVNAKGGDKDYVVKTIPSWCKYEKNGGELIITVDNNTTESKREGIIVLNHVNSSDCSTSFKVKQLYSEFNITITPDTSNIPVNGGMVIFTVGLSGGTSNNDFNIVSSPNWCTLKKRSDKNTRSVLTGEVYLEVNVPENTGVIERSGDIVVSHIDSPSVTATAVIKQVAQELKISVTPNSYTFPQNGGVMNFDVSVEGGNAGYRVQKSNNWLTVSNGQNGKLVVTATENSDLANRNGEIVISHVDDVSKKTTITINQESGYNIEVVPDNGIFPKSGGTLEFSVNITGGTTNSFKTKVNNDGNWLSIKSTSNNKLVIEANENPGNLTRSTSVNVIHNNSNNVVDTILVSQMANTGLLVQPTEINALSSGGTYSINVLVTGGFNPDFGISTPNMPDWLYITKTNNGVDVVASVTADNKPRQYTGLEIYNMNNTSERERVTITQDAQVFTISVTPSVIEVESSGYETDLNFNINGGGKYIVKNNPVSDWVTVNEISGLVASLVIQENTGTKRNGTITFAHSMDETKTVTVEVKQEAALSIDAQPDTINFVGDGATSEVSLAIDGPSGSTFIINTKPDWITVSKLDDYKASITVGKNDGDEERVGDVMFSHSLNHDLSTFITVKQDFYKDIHVTPESLEQFDSTGGTKNASVTIIGGVDATYTVVSKPDWITISNIGNVTGSTTISVTAANNDSGEDRTGTIVLAHSLNDEKQVTIQVEQLFLLDLILESCDTEISGVTFPYLVNGDKTFQTSVIEQGGVTKFTWNQDVVSFDLVISGNSSYNGTAEIDANNPKMINVSALGELDSNSTSIVLQNVKFANNNYVVKLVTKVKPKAPTILSFTPNYGSDEYPRQFKLSSTPCWSNNDIWNIVTVRLNGSDVYTIKFDIPVVPPTVEYDNILWYTISANNEWNWELYASFSSDRKTVTLKWTKHDGEPKPSGLCNVWYHPNSFKFDNGFAGNLIVFCDRTLK